MKRILGLDLGTNSIGWALVEIDHDNKIVRILGLGSRILNMNAAEISKFESGAKIVSATAQRRDIRSHRKLNERFLLRRDRLHCVLNLINALPTHYKLSIEFETGNRKRSGKFRKGTEEKLAYIKDDNGKTEFLFKEAYEQMEADFKQVHPDLFNKKSNEIIRKLPFDWTLYYLRHKAVTDPNYKLTKEQLSWITLSFNQKRGYEKVIGENEKMQKEGERLDNFVGKVKEINKIEEDLFEVVLSDINNESIELFRYKEESKIAITEIGDLKEVERIFKYEDCDVEESKTEYIINELRNLLVTNVKATGQKKQENFIFEIELETGWRKELQSRYTPQWKNTRRDFIVKTKYNEIGNRIVKGLDKGRNIGIPKEEDWKLLKLKTETSITNFNAKHHTIGVASFIYHSLLQNPYQKIKGDLVTVIERDYYREELETIYNNQEKFHPELRDKGLYINAIELLYPHNTNHQNNLRELNFNHLIREDILMYQRDLKSKKSLISDCVYESRSYRDKNTNEIIIVPNKVIHKYNPIFQEFRLWQLIRRLKIIKKQELVNEEIRLNIDVTSQLLNSIEIKEKLYEYLNDREFVTEKIILAFLSKNHGDKTICQENYKWNFTSEKEPCNTTRHEFILRTKSINGFDYRKFLSSEAEHSLWHFFYSVKQKDEFYKGISSLLIKLLDKSGLSNDFLPELVKNFSAFSGYPNDYGTYSEKAIKKLLSFLRVGKYWNQMEVETYLKKDLALEIKKSVIHKENLTGEIKEFQGLMISSACYLVYGRYSEVGDVKYWLTPYDMEDFLQHEFKQHSLNNPIVEKVIVETLQVVKDIWKHFGEKLQDEEKCRPVYSKLFDEIHIELGREMKKNNKQKKRDDEQNKENRRTNERIIEILKELKKNNPLLEIKSPFQQEKLRIIEDCLLASITYHKDSTDYTNIDNTTNDYPYFKITKKEIKELISKDVNKISKNELERYKLWLDQRYQSPYTGKFIRLSDLFDRKKYEIEHIFPQVRITLNSLSNKVICETEINKEKQAKTGYGFILTSQGKEIFCTAHNSKVKVLNAEEYEQLVNRNFIDKKREILLSKDVPQDFTNNQRSNMQYITKMAMKLLSNIVREKEEDSFRSKNVIVTNGTITSILKKHWKLNETWNELTAPRFKRLNEITNTKLFGDYRKINGHDVFIYDLPEEIRKNFDLKRIDHRHHAMDALVIALTSNEHVQYLNNISSQEESDDQKLKTRIGLKYLLTNSRKGLNEEKEWYFLPPAQKKSANGIIEFEYCFKEFKSMVFNHIAKEALELTVASFKQQNRIIRQRWNKYHKCNEVGKNEFIKEVNLSSKLKFNVRQPLHLDTFYGRIKLQNNGKATDNMFITDIRQAIKGGYDIYDRNIKERIKWLHNENKSEDEIINLLSKEYPKVKVYTKFVASRYGNELTSLVNVEKINKSIESITDTGIQKILGNHLEKYKSIVDTEGRDVPPQTLAFSPDGIKELNQNITLLNDGKSHCPIYKVRMAIALGTKFSVSETGTKSKMYVVSASGSNAFCGIYGYGKERKYYIPTLRESVERLKQGCQPCTESHPDNNEYKLLFVLKPNDLVYVPTQDEIEILPNFNCQKLSKEQILRIYKFTDGSENADGNIINFIPVNIAAVLFNLNKEKQKKAGINIPIQNEIGIGSQGSKSQNSLDGIQIKSVCLKLKVDRLGNLKIQPISSIVQSEQLMSESHE